MTVAARRTTIAAVFTPGRSIVLVDNVIPDQVDTALGVDLTDLDFKFIADIHHVFHLFNPTVFKLGNVDHTILAGSQFNESTEVHDANHLTGEHIAYFDIPTALTLAAMEHIHSQIGMAILISIAFWIACMLVDQIVAMILLIPLVFPMASAMGMDPIYVGVLVCLQAAIGFITPPFGSNIFVACAAFKRPYIEIVKGLPAYLIILFVISVSYILFPDLALIYRAVI